MFGISDTVNTFATFHIHYATVVFNFSRRLQGASRDSCVPVKLLASSVTVFI